MKEFVFLEIFAMCIPKIAALFHGIACIESQSYSPKHERSARALLLRRTVICDTNECSGPGVADIDWSILNSVHMVMHESLSTIDEYVEYETSSKDLSMVVEFTDD